MDFWDRLCRYLKVRKVTVMDVSRKHGMDYRLLHAVVAGCSWYGNWGYELGSGNYGTTAEAYKKAAEYLSNLPLSLSAQSREPQSQVHEIIAFHQALSHGPLHTLRELFSHIVKLATDTNGDCNLKESSAKDCKLKLNLEKPTTGSFSRRHGWPASDVVKAVDIMLNILRAADGSRWFTWRTLKRALSKSVASLELVDHCLKNIGGRKTKDGKVVVQRCNEETNSIEYRLESVDATVQCFGSGACSVTRDHALRDLVLLYDALLNPHTIGSDKPPAVRESVRQSANVILDYKKFIKHYDEAGEFPSCSTSELPIWCHVSLDDKEDGIEMPPELLILPATATVKDLKDVAMKALRETYIVLRTFQAELLLDCPRANGAMQVQLIYGPSGHAHVRGRRLCRDRHLSLFRMERGMESWTVSCSCGATDDDGERMLACDRCGVWWHTRCSGIPDLHPSPKRFVCALCKSLRKRSPPVYEWAASKRAKCDDLLHTPLLSSAAA